MKYVMHKCVCSDKNLPLILVKVNDKYLPK